MNHGRNFLASALSGFVNLARTHFCLGSTGPVLICRWSAGADPLPAAHLASGHIGGWATGGHRPGPHHRSGRLQLQHLSNGRDPRPAGLQEYPSGVKPGASCVNISIVLYEHPDGYVFTKPKDSYPSAMGLWNDKTSQMEKIHGLLASRNIPLASNQVPLGSTPAHLSISMQIIL